MALSGSGNLTSSSRPKKIGKYDIVGTLGRGAMGVVYKGQDPEIGRIVAVKTLRKLSELETSRREKVLARFKSEARAAGNLRHPNIITVFEANVEDQIPYIVMDHVAGESFDQLLAKRGQLTPEVTLFYMNQVAIAIDYAHKNGVIHRDLKPGNLVVNEDNQVFVLDFGIARISDSFGEVGAKSKKEPVMGTPGYMSPEQIVNKPLDNRSDLFSLGIIIYECLTGRRPFLGKDFNEILENILNTEPAPLTNIAGVTGEVVYVMNKALAKNKDDRFNSAAELIAAFQEAFGVSNISKFPESKNNTSASFDGVKEWQSLASQKVNRPGFNSNSDETCETASQVNQPGASGLQYSPAVITRSLRSEQRSPGQLHRAGSTATKTDLHGTTSTAKKLFFILFVIASTAVCVILGFYVLAKNNSSTDSNNKKTPISKSQTTNNISGASEENAIADIDSPNIATAGKVVAELSAEDLLQSIESRETDEVFLLAALREAERRRLPELIGVLGISVQHDSLNLRIEAVKILGRSLDVQALDLLLPSLDDYDPRVRIAAAQSIQAIGSRKALSYLAARQATEDIAAVKLALKAAIDKIQGFETKTK